VPFIVELPNLCFIVEIPMNKAAQNDHLKYFELIQVVNKDNEIINIGHKCTFFWAYSRGFKLIGKGFDSASFCELINDDSTISSFELTFEPYGWKAQPDSEIDNPDLSLDEMPADSYEAWDIYSRYITWQYQEKINKIVDDLNNNLITPEYIKNKLPTIYQHYQRSKRIDINLDFNELERAIFRHALNEISIKNQRNSKNCNRSKGSKSHPAVSNINLLDSYFYTLEHTPNIKKIEALRNALTLFYPELNKEEREDILPNLKKAVRRMLKKDEEIIRFNYPHTF